VFSSRITSVVRVGAAPQSSWQVHGLWRSSQPDRVWLLAKTKTACETPAEAGLAARGEQGRLVETSIRARQKSARQRWRIGQCRVETRAVRYSDRIPPKNGVTRRECGAPRTEAGGYDLVPGGTAFVGPNTRPGVRGRAQSGPREALLASALTGGFRPGVGTVACSTVSARAKGIRAAQRTRGLRAATRPWLVDRRAGRRLRSPRRDPPAVGDARGTNLASTREHPVRRARSGHALRPGTLHVVAGLSVGHCKTQFRRTVLFDHRARSTRADAV